MGCWTQYCLICGGPGENYYDNHINENIYSSKNTKWLDKVQVICNDYVTKNGKYDTYGNVDIEEDDNMYCVCPTNWIEFDFTPGLLVHSVCLELMYKIFINFDNKVFFNVLKIK